MKKNKRKTENLTIHFYFCPKNEYKTHTSLKIYTHK